MPRRRPEAWRTGYAIRGTGGGLTAATVFGNEWFYSSTAARKGDGRNPDTPSRDMDQIMGDIGSHDAIYVAGDVRFQGLAPLGVFGVRIIGAYAGRNRHVTSSGVVLTGNGGAWREEATAGDGPLLELREQGWEIHNLMMIPQSGYAAVKLHCEESATYPDASHFIASNVRFFSSGTRVGYGIEDYGGAAHIGVYNCEFTSLEFGYNPTNVSIRSPQDQEWIGNTFQACKHDIVGNFVRSTFQGNRHRTVYDGTTHPNTLNLAYTSDAGVAATANYVTDVLFADNTADVTIAKGYKPATGDRWRFRCANVAADVVTVPS